MKSLLNFKIKIEKTEDQKIKKEACRYLQWFFGKQNINRDSIQITDVNVLGNNKKKITIQIILGRPGLIIGKAGRTIDALRVFMEDYFQKEVEIKIKESKLWY